MLKPLAPLKTIPNVAQDQPVPFSYQIWKALRIFRRDDIKFGIKVGVGAALYVGAIELWFRLRVKLLLTELGSTGFPR